MAFYGGATTGGSTRLREINMQFAQAMKVVGPQCAAYARQFPKGQRREAYLECLRQNLPNYLRGGRGVQ